MTCWYGGGGAKHYGLKNMDCEPVGPGRRWKWRWQVEVKVASGGEGGKWR